MIDRGLTTGRCKRLYKFYNSTRQLLATVDALRFSRRRIKNIQPTECESLFLFPRELFLKYIVILGDPGAASKADRMFVVNVLLLQEREDPLGTDLLLSNQFQKRSSSLLVILLN